MKFISRVRRDFMNVPKRSHKKNLVGWSLFYKPVRSGASRKITIIRFRSALQIKHKNLCVKVSNKAGRNNKGRIITRTKGAKDTNFNRPKINYYSRTRRVGFIGSIVFVPFLNKMVSTVFYSSGCAAHITTTTEHSLLNISSNGSPYIHYWARLRGINFQQNSAPFIINTTSFILNQLPKNRPVCLLERVPYEGVKYVRAVGTSARIIKMDSRTNLGIVILPSGIYKIFSIHSIGAIGKVAPLETRKFKNTKAGYRKKYGFKSIVRGVAMNPIDHPHGGRTNTLKYPRTPWGKTTKLK